MRTSVRTAEVGGVEVVRLTAAGLARFGAGRFPFAIPALREAGASTIGMGGGIIDR
jgi:hypothetical protein